MSAAKLPQWTGELGPRQAADFKKAWGKLGTAFSTYESSTPGLRITRFDLTGAYAPGEAEAKRAIGERHAWTVGRANVRAVIAEIEAATAARLANCPGDGCWPCACNGAVPHLSKDHARAYVAPEVPTHGR